MGRTVLWRVSWRRSSVLSISRLSVSQLGQDSQTEIRMMQFRLVNCCVHWCPLSDGSGGSMLDVCGCLKCRCPVGPQFHLRFHSREAVFMVVTSTESVQNHYIKHKYYRTMSTLSITSITVVKLSGHVFNSKWLTNTVSHKSVPLYFRLYHSCFMVDVCNSLYPWKPEWILCDHI